MNPPDVHITLLKDSFDIDYQATVNCVEAGMARVALVFNTCHMVHQCSL